MWRRSYRWVPTWSGFWRRSWWKATDGKGSGTRQPSDFSVICVTNPRVSTCFNLFIKFISHLCLCRNLFLIYAFVGWLKWFYLRLCFRFAPCVSKGMSGHSKSLVQCSICSTFQGSRQRTWQGQKLVGRRIAVCRQWSHCKGRESERNAGHRMSASQQTFVTVTFTPAYAQSLQKSHPVPYQAWHLDCRDFTSGHHAASLHQEPSVLTSQVLCLPHTWWTK